MKHVILFMLLVACASVLGTGTLGCQGKQPPRSQVPANVTRGGCYCETVNSTADKQVPYAAPASPQLLWSTQIHREFSLDNYRDFAGPAVLNSLDQAFILSASSLLAVGPDGKVQWADGRFPPNEYGNSPLVTKDGAIDYFSADLQLVSFDCVGNLLWHQDIAGANNDVTGSLSTDPAENIYCTLSTSVSAFKPQGQPLWQAALPDSYSTGPVTSNSKGELLLATQAGIACFDSGGLLKQELSLSPGSGLPIGHVAIGARNMAFVHTLDGNVYCLDSKLSQQWKTKVTSSALGSGKNLIAVDKEGNCYLGLFEWKVVSLSPQGQLRWQFTTKGAVKSQLLLMADTTVVALDDRGTLYALAKDTGDLLWKFDSQHPSSNGQLAANSRGVVLFPADDGSLVAVGDPH